jgi:hypothetical protein
MGFGNKKTHRRANNNDQESSRKLPCERAEINRNWLKFILKPSKGKETKQPTVKQPRFN